MNVAVAVLTFNRLHLLKRTLTSMNAAPGHPFRRVVVDGGSDSPEQRAFVASLPGSYQFPSKVSVGRSMNMAIDLAEATKPEIIVFSADDYEYRPDWLAKLVRFWKAAPNDIGLATLNWEPDYAWNTVLDHTVIGAQQVLIRNTVPGSSWSFRAKDWKWIIGPMEDRTGGEDLTVCRSLQASGYRLAALDLTNHIGERESAWGNQSWRLANPLKLS